MPARASCAWKPGAPGALTLEQVFVERTVVKTEITLDDTTIQAEALTIRSDADDAKDTDWKASGEAVVGQLSGRNLLGGFVRSDAESTPDIIGGSVTANSLHGRVIAVA